MKDSIFKRAITCLLALVMVLSLAACGAKRAKDAENVEEIKGVKDVKLSDIYEGNLDVENIYCLEYNNDYSFSDKPSKIEFPSSGTIYVIRTDDKNFIVVVCNSNGNRIVSLSSYDLLSDERKNGDIDSIRNLTSDLNFVTECIQGATKALENSTAGEEQSVNIWYMFTDAEVNAMK